MAHATNVTNLSLDASDVAVPRGSAWIAPRGNFDRNWALTEGGKNNTAESLFWHGPPRDSSGEYRCTGLPTVNRRSILRCRLFEPAVSATEPELTAKKPRACPLTKIHGHGVERVACTTNGPLATVDRILHSRTRVFSLFCLPLSCLYSPPSQFARRSRASSPPLFSYFPRRFSIFLSRGMSTGITFF